MNSAGKIYQIGKQDSLDIYQTSSDSAKNNKAHSTGEAIMESLSNSSNGILEADDFAKDTGIFRITSGDQRDKVSTPDSNKKISRRSSFDELEVVGGNIKKLFNPAMFMSKYQKKDQAQENRPNNLDFQIAQVTPKHLDIPKVGDKRKIDTSSGQIEGS